MKHGTILLALTCWSAGALYAADASIPASVGMPGVEVLSPDQWEAIDGGDLFLDVNRDSQMMTVTRITPGNYNNIECYSVKVTTSVTRNSDLSSTQAKGAMENTSRNLSSMQSKLIPEGETRKPTQFPSGTAKISSTAGTQDQVTGPVLRTNASQLVNGTNAKKQPGTFVDTGYNIHYVDPAKATNTLGCVGVQSLSGMNKVANSLKVDNASYSPGQTPNQTINVTAYTNGTPPPAATFAATEKKPVSKKKKKK